MIPQTFGADVEFTNGHNIIKGIQLEDDVSMRWKVGVVALQMHCSSRTDEARVLSTQQVLANHRRRDERRLVRHTDKKVV